MIRTREPVRPCSECARPTRSSRTKLKDQPGTVVRGAVNLCMTCYQRQQRTTPSLSNLAPEPRAPRKAVSSAIFATVPDARDPQRSDCKVRCCRNPFMCGTQFRCACHGVRS